MVDNFDDVFAGPLILELGSSEYHKVPGDHDTRGKYDEI